MEEGWNLFSNRLMESAVEELGYSSKRSKDWFDSNADGIQELLEAKHKENAAFLRNPSSEFLKRKWRERVGPQNRGCCVKWRISGGYNWQVRPKVTQIPANYRIFMLL